MCRLDEMSFAVAAVAASNTTAPLGLISRCSMHRMQLECVRISVTAKHANNRYKQHCSQISACCGAGVVQTAWIHRREALVEVAGPSVRVEL